MQQDCSPLGSVFSDWTLLTEEYAEAMDALRRQEPGASTRMMEIAHRMKQYGRHPGAVTEAIRGPVIPGRMLMTPRAGWVARAAQFFSGVRLPAGASHTLLPH